MVGERSHLAHADIDLDTHVADVCGVLQFEELSDVILVGHSYGGMVATGVADRARDRVAKLVYLDAFAPRNGESAFDLLPAAVRNQRKGNGEWRMPPGAMPPIRRQPTAPGPSRSECRSRSKRSNRS